MFQSSSVRGVGLGNRSMEVRIFQEVSVLIGARRGARLACCDHSECCCLGFSPHRCEAWGSASGNIAFSWPKGSFSPHRCEAWGSAIGWCVGLSAVALFQSSSVRGVGLGHVTSFVTSRAGVSVLIGARRGARLTTRRSW